MITKQDVADAEAKLLEAKQHLIDLKRAYAAQQCPLSIGDKAVVNDFAHTGKEIIVDCIRSPKYSFYGEWQADGYVLKSDGKPGKLRGSVIDRNS